MKRYTLTKIALLATGLAVAIGSISTTAFAATGAANQPEVDSGYSFLVPTQVTEQDIRSVVDDQYQAETGIPADISHRLIQLTLDQPELRIASTEWDESTGKLLLYSAADAQTATESLRGYGLDGWVDYAPAARSADELNAIIRDLIGTTGELATGQQVALVIPTADASGIELVLDEEQAGDAQRGGGTFPDLSDVGLSVDISYGPMPDASARDMNGSVQKFSGAYMQNGLLSCTTGWRMTQQSTNEPIMGTAHHCGAGKSDSGVSSTLYPNWFYSSSTANGWSMGTWSGGVYPGGATYGDAAVWTGSGLSNFVPGILIGGNTGSTVTVNAIKGAITSSVGGFMCYSGNRSGTVCNNYIEDTNVSACYGNGLPCYNGLVLTQQQTNVPAAGSGDSGGPAYATYEGRIYAMGVISGVVNYNQTCTGDPGRDCSTRVLYSPINEFFGAGYGLNYIP